MLDRLLLGEAAASSSDTGVGACRRAEAGRSFHTIVTNVFGPDRLYTDCLHPFCHREVCACLRSSVSHPSPNHATQQYTGSSVAF